MATKFSNNASATLASSITNVATSIAVTSGQGALFPSLAAGEFFFATLVDSSNNLEIVKVTARSTDTLTVTRAQDGTTARAYTAGDKLELRVVAASFDTFVQTDNTQTISGAKTFSGANTFSGNNTFSGVQTFSQTIVGSINGNAATATNASAVTNGVYTTGDQTIGGIKTFSSTIVLNNSQNFQVKDSGGTARNFFTIGGDNVVSLFNSGNNTVRILNQAGGSTLVTLTDASGNFTAAGNVTAYSDERLKTNWRDVQDDFVTRLSGVKNGVYERTDIHTTQVGVSAQSFEEVLPEAILKDKDGIYSVNYANAALVAAIQLAKEVVALRKRLEVLEGK